MVSTGTAKLIILVVMLTTFYAFFDYSIRGTFQTVAQPTGISEMQFARLNLTSPYSDFQNVSNDNVPVQFEITANDLYQASWLPGAQDFRFRYKHWLWDRILVRLPNAYQANNSLTEQEVIDNWDSTGNYTLALIDPGGGKEQNVYFFIRSNSTHELYPTIDASITAGEISMLIGGQLPRLETDFFAIVGVVGTSFLTGLAAPFTQADYPVVLSLINYMIVILGAIALALLLRG